MILPDIAAGCSMADMAEIDQVEAAWEDLGEVIDVEDLTPVTYVNSTAGLKAFCGRHGGIVCTSANADKVLECAFQRTRRVLFFPDQHLGRNISLKMGITNEQMPVWNPYDDDLGGNTEEAIPDCHRCDDRPLGCREVRRLPSSRLDRPTWLSGEMVPGTSNS